MVMFKRFRCRSFRQNLDGVGVRGCCCCGRPGGLRFFKQCY